MVIVESSRLQPSSTRAPLTPATMPGRSAPTALNEKRGTCETLRRPTHAPAAGGSSGRPAGPAAGVAAGGAAGLQGEMSMEQRFTLAGMLRHYAEESGGRPMFRLDGRTVTWAEHATAARRVAQAMRREGVGPGERIALVDRNGLEYFEVLFGGAMLGAVNVAVN